MRLRVPIFVAALALTFFSTKSFAQTTTVTASATNDSSLATSASASEHSDNKSKVTQLETVVVIGTSPLPGAGIDIDKIPGNTQTLSTTNLSQEGSPSLITALNNQLSSISINDNLNSPFQPDILYRGFEASPVVGTPQGLAVYQNGVRINEAFGDAVNWDFIPDLAIKRIDLMSANPVYGLNALGGAIIVNMKDGFNYHGGQAELLGGSFGRYTGNFQYGTNKGHFGVYVAARYLNEDGWRDFSPTTLRQGYVDFSAHFDKLILDLSVTGADNDLFGEGATPIQELDIDRSLTFTTPQSNFNRLIFPTLNGQYAVTDNFSLQGNMYYRRFQQSVENGDKTEYVVCTSPPNIGFLCQNDGLTPLIDAQGHRITDISGGGTRPIGQINAELINTTGEGASLQATSTKAIYTHENHFVVGATLDHASTDFLSTTEVGTINSSLQVDNSGLFVDTPENTTFNVTPVHVNAKNTYYGLFATDTINLTTALALTASGRYNIATVNLTDLIGTGLNGNHTFKRLNPALGFTYKIIPSVTVYAGYAEGSRAPTPSELECSDPSRPCLLPSSLSSDPPLNLVISHTYETGLRGTTTLPKLYNGQLSWNVGLYRTNVIDDILAIATSNSAGYFANVGQTRRAGGELGISYSTDNLTTYANYSYVHATFQSNLTMPSPSNPFQDADGNIFVYPGDTMPGIPMHRVKAGIDYHPHHWAYGANLVYVSSQFYRGDESNQLSPLGGYFVFNLHTSYWINPNIELFGSINNVLNSKYSTFGLLGDPTGVGAPGIPKDAVTNGPGVNNRFLGPAAPFSAYAGLRLKF